MSSVLLLVALAAAPCGPLAPAAADPELAATYLEVGQAELEAGDFEAAATALSRALSFDRSLTRAVALRERACLSLGERSLDQVDALMDAGRWREALAALAAIPRASPGASALLEGICHYELGDDGAANRVLELALKDPQQQADARVLLALISLRRGAARGAEVQLRALEQSGRVLGAPLTAMLRQASRGGALTLRASLFGGADSNPTLSPMGLGAETSQGLLGLTALAQWVPLGAVSPYLRVAVGGREYPQLPQLRTGTAVGTVGFQLGRGGDRLAVDYSVDALLFGLEPYAVTHGPRLEGSLQLGPVLLFAEWNLRFETFLPEDAEVFSGLRQDTALGLSAALPGGFSVEAAWSLGRDGAQLAELALLEHGPRLTLGWAGGRTRVMMGAAFDWRSFDAFDEDLGVQREDLRLRPSARVEVDLTEWLSVFVAGDMAFISSNVAAVSSLRFAGTGGVQLWAGLW